MTVYFSGVLGLFDNTISALFGVPVLALFFAFLLLKLAFGIFHLVMAAARSVK